MKSTSIQNLVLFLTKKEKLFLEIVFLNKVLYNGKNINKNNKEVNGGNKINGISK